MTYLFEGVLLSNKDYTDIETSILQSYPKGCILYIDRVINDNLDEKFQSCLKSLQEKRGEQKIFIKRLFHGTRTDNINSIADNGFKVTANIRSAYGIGTYFSTNASYSRDYTDMDKDDISYMFVCDVLIGNQDIILGSKKIPENLDNSVNDRKTPTIYVTPYDNGCIPRFLVAFYKNAH